MFFSNISTLLLIFLNNPPTFAAKCITYSGFSILNNFSVGLWHKDKDYSHNELEVNFFISITDSINTSAVWVESIEDRGDYKPLNAKYGEYVIWNGSNLKHGNKENKEGVTRVSFDFRVMRYSDYNFEERANKESIHAKEPMIIGEYYEEL